jgi:hypothetical protein
MQRTINPITKTALTNIVFYLAAFTLIYIGNKESSGGPCVPGMGFLFYMLLIPFSLTSSIKNAILAVRGNEIRYVSLLIHFTALIIIAIYFFY